MRILAGGLVLGLALMLASCSEEPPQGVEINGQALDPALRDALAAQGASIPDGRYWYDPLSGLWGRAGGPPEGITLPGLGLGGPLPTGASARGGDSTGTGIFINGREISTLEQQQLTQLFGAVQTGRYWLNAQFIGGIEGGPPAFDIGAAIRARGGSGQPGGQGWTHYTPGIGGTSGTSVGQDENGCAMVSSPSGSYFGC